MFLKSKLINEKFDNKGFPRFSVKLWVLGINEFTLFFIVHLKHLIIASLCHNTLTRNLENSTEVVEIFKITVESIDVINNIQLKVIAMTCMSGAELLVYFRKS